MVSTVLNLCIHTVGILQVSRKENRGLGWFAGIYATHRFPRSNVFLRGQMDLNTSSIKVRYDDDHFGTINSYTEQETARKLNFAVSLGMT